MYSDFDEKDNLMPTRRVKSTDMLPENKTGSNKVMISGEPYYWEQYMWVRDTQARPGEYSGAPICEDPQNVRGLF